MWSSVLTVAALIAVLTYVFQYRDWLDWNKKSIYKVAPGPCKQIIADGGSEDLMHIGDGIVLISTGLFEDRGEIRALNVNTQEVVTMTIQGAPDREDFMISPHGMSTWTDEEGQIYLYVVTNPPTEDKVEVFKVKKEHNVLEYKRTITDPKFSSIMNDLVAVGRDQFYITTFFYYRSNIVSILEYMTKTAWGSVLFFDGERVKDVIPSGLLMPNGITMSPDGKMIYMAEFGKKLLHGYHRSGDNFLTKAWEYNADTLLDNINVDPDSGDLWAGCHPVAYRIFDSMSWNEMLGPTLPSQVLRFKMKDNMVSEVEEIYADDGSELNGSSTATYVNGTLVVGTYRAQTLVCEVKYLSP